MPPKDLDIPGLIEEKVRDSRLVDSGLLVLSRYLNDAPAFDPEKRRFLKYCAGLVGAGVLSIGPVKKAEAFLNLFQKRDWKAYLMGQDLIRGPSLLIWRGWSQDFERHRSQSWNEGYGAVDYEVPIGTPITPIQDGKIWIKREGHIPGTILVVLHKSDMGLYSSSYLHLSERIIEEKSKKVGFGDVIAISGNSGYINTEAQPEHLHLQISEVKNINSKDTSKKLYRTVQPGFDPFRYGIDGNKPVYWDTKTEIEPTSPWTRESYLQNVLDTLESRIKSTEIDEQTKRDILSRRNNPEGLREYLGREVLNKHQGKNGEFGYKYLPGNILYTLMLEVFAYTSKQPFIVMLPFPHPMLKSFYQRENPGIQF
ncbi:MAG: M23 family metallopeptidase [Candidatus Aenigmarchaeota archaeon]|nr:M23 family metallopeptidase [Candidatus Aenigmarchaeota archaeon]